MIRAMKHMNEGNVHQTPEPTPAGAAHQTCRCVFVTDSQGIRDIFPLLTYQLGVENYTHLTLLYSHKPTDQLFTAELENLEKQFAQKLQVYYYTQSDPMYMTHSTDTKALTQEQLEIIINEDSCNQVQFILWGVHEMVDFVHERLLFLGISHIHISTKLTF